MQQFDATKENEFMEFEKKFAELERSRPDFPKGRRLQCEFPTIQKAYEALDFFSGDSSHEKLLKGQLPFFKQVRIEFYKNLEM
jgi:hypothetical protein